MCLVVGGVKWKYVYELLLFLERLDDTFVDFRATAYGKVIGIWTSEIRRPTTVDDRQAV